MGKSHRWRQTRGDDLVVVANRQVMQCDGRVALMAVAEGMTVADERGVVMADGTDKM